MKKRNGKKFLRRQARLVKRSVFFTFQVKTYDGAVAESVGDGRTKKEDLPYKFPQKQTGT